ncbi:MAG: ion transporter [Mycobacterium sp.]|nr:ion transporter [Mycobacterium sp.]
MQRAIGHTIRGRVIVYTSFGAVALMIAGVSLLGVVTATLASWIVESVAAEDTEGQAATAAQLDELREEVRKLTESLIRAGERTYGEAGTPAFDTEGGR